MRLDSDDFQLLGLPRRYALDPHELDERRRALQAAVHPDRHDAGDSVAQRVAMQWAVRVNEAHARLKDPLQRAAYLCELTGNSIRAEDNTAMPTEFLKKQMAWREALDEASDRLAIEALRRELGLEREAAYARLAQAIDEAHDYVGAADQTRALMFTERLAADVDDRLLATEA